MALPTIPAPSTAIVIEEDLVCKGREKLLDVRVSGYGG